VYKGKGDARAPGNHRPISLLSIPGKVYATILLRRVSALVDHRLLDNQCAFRKGRGLSDASFVVRNVMRECVWHKQALFMAFVDLRKAYDCIPRDALWRVLSAFGVPSKLVALLVDLHTGTMAAVKLGRGTGAQFHIQCGVRQGCVIAPLLFNVFFDCVVRVALAAMPAECGVQLAYQSQGELWPRRPDAPASCVTVNCMIYADDLVLMSRDQQELEAMLVTFDRVCSECGMTVNAAKTQLMCVCGGPPAAVALAPVRAPVQLLGGAAEYVSSFKYLGGIVDATGTCDAEAAARARAAKGRFAQMQRVWNVQRMPLGLRMQCYNAYVLPVLLFGAETLSLTTVQEKKLQRVHNGFLRQLMFVRNVDRVQLAHIYCCCRTVCLSEHLSACRLRWLGHVLRQEHGRLPHVALHSKLHELRNKCGKPPMAWRHCAERDLRAHGLPVRAASLSALCADKPGWRAMLYRLTHPPAQR
jgi:hypothetical protein